MYLILNRRNIIAEISKHPVYIKHQDNGVDILSDKEHADMIYSNDTDTFYPCGEYELISVDNIPEHITAGYYYRGGNFYTYGNPLITLIRAKTPRQGVLLLEQAENIENALCDIDMAAEQRLADIENALCDIDMGGME